MLIKATRIRAASGADALVRHLLAGNDNEEIVVVRGTVGDLHDAVDDARRFSRAYALRHFVIAPAIAMDHVRFEQAAQALSDEFDFDPDLALIVEHKKTRAVDGAADRHWHVVVAETNPATGKVLSSRFNHARHEKVARILELAFGHPIVPGAHDRAVLAALRAEGKGALADQLLAGLAQGERPVAAFSTELHQSAKREGIDLAIVREVLRGACADTPSVAVLRQRLADHGLAIESGAKAGVWVLRGPEGQFLGAAHRLSGLRKTDFNTIMETNYDHDTANCSADDLGRHAGPPAGHGNDPAAGKGHGSAPRGREHVVPRGDAGIVAESRQQGGTDGTEPRGDASAFRSAGDCAGASQDDRRGLTAAVVHVGKGVLALSKAFVGTSTAESVQNHLAEQERKLRGRISVAMARTNPEMSNRLYAARLYRDGAQERHGAALRSYREAQERLAAAPEPRHGVLDRILGRQSAASGMALLERGVAAARDDLIAAGRGLSSAEANLARVEKAEAEERRRLTVEAETERRNATVLLAEVLMAQRMVRAFPSATFCGPAFVAWAGGKIERKRRRGLRNPFAVNIWGLPIDP